MNDWRSGDFFWCGEEEEEGSFLKNVPFTVKLISMSPDWTCKKKEKWAFRRCVISSTTGTTVFAFYACVCLVITAWGQKRKGNHLRTGKKRLKIEGVGSSRRRKMRAEKIVNDFTPRKVGHNSQNAHEMEAKTSEFSLFSGLVWRR